MDTQHLMKPLTLGIIIIFTLVANIVNADDKFADIAIRQAVVEQMEFIQIPGPNPIISPGPEGSWDDRVVEASDAIEDLGTYYFYYHATNRRAHSYQLGVASASSPLGPFKKHGDKPVIPAGPKGSWDDQHAACALVVKIEGEGDNAEAGKFLMWYSGCTDDDKWSMGLATADHPLGPWKKYEGNPILTDFGYLGGVINVDGKWRIYSAHPIHMPWAGWKEGRSRSLDYHSDYSPLAVAIGDKPEGPYVKYEGNPLMVKGEPGDWDDGGISEAEVLYDNGMFHMFYGGTRRYGPRTESVGYAYSFDGLEWYKFGKNPIAAHQANPNTAAFAEVHAIIEQPFIYLYHTMRPEVFQGRSHPWVEALGVQVLITQRPFSLDMPAVFLDSLDAGASTSLEDAQPISLSNITRLSLTVESAYSDKAKNPLRIHVRGSYDGINYDTVDLHTLDHVLQTGQLARKTFQLDSHVHFIKVIVENPDKQAGVKNIHVRATLGG